MIKIYDFGLGGETPDVDNTVLGGKGYGLMQMSAKGIPVPPGVTLPCSLCIDYLKGDLSYGCIEEEIEEKLKLLEEHFGYMPLVSVRSGARVSMPGMMDTILNVGLTDETIEDWEARIGQRAAWDSYRRLYQMYGDVVLGIDKAWMDSRIAKVMSFKYGLKESPTSMEEWTVKHYKSLINELKTKIDLPQTLMGQLAACVSAVWSSWNNPRAIQYRKMNGYPDDWGTAVNVQAMVFGNMNEYSGSGVLFTRDPATGAPGLTGEFLPNAQGEDVVAGIRTPIPYSKFGAWNAHLAKELHDIAVKLESDAKDMQDIEFTVQSGKLYILQTRNGKRSAKSAFKVAYDLYMEGVITRSEAIKRVTLSQYHKAIRPAVKEETAPPAVSKGIPASTGVVKGRAVFTPGEAVVCKEPCILIREETTPEDLEGMTASVGILTATGGFTSHAAVVARSLDKVCVTGCLGIDVKDKTIKGDDGTLYDLTGAMITLDGETGRIWVNEDVEVVSGENAPEVKALREAALDISGSETYLRVGASPNGAYKLRQGVKHYVDTSTINHLELNDWKSSMASLMEAAVEVEVTVAVKIDPELVDADYYHRLFGIKETGQGSEVWESRLDWLRKLNEEGGIPSNVVFVSRKLKGLDDTLPMVRSVETIADLLKGGRVLLSSDFIEEVVGGDTALSDLMNALVVAGHKVEQVNEGITEMQALKKAFGNV